MRRFIRLSCIAAVLALSLAPFACSLEKQPSSVYHARRTALAAKLRGGVAVLFAAEEPQLDFMPYRQDADFYYLTGWNEPGAALLIVSDAPQAPAPRAYKEILFLPTRDLRMEKYTGAKLDASSPGVAEAAGVDAVLAMTELPAVLNRLIAADRRLAGNVWTQPGALQAKALLGFTAATLGMDAGDAAHDVTEPAGQLRAIKDEGEIALLRKASDASIAGQRAMMRAVKPGVTERALAGEMTAVWMENGCERASYAPIVGSGIDSTVLHYSENTRTLEDGDILLVDAACEYSMYASDITRTVPVNGRFTARQREIYNIVLGAQQAAIDAFVAGKSKINDRDRRDPDSLDNAAYNYINTHGKDLHGQPLGQYWLHGLGHLVGIDVHDPAEYPALLKPGMVFTIEPGVYIPDEKLGVRIECVFLVGADGKLIDLAAALPHTAEDVEAAMRGK
ncbi:MAG: Xaa-Pro peptidase family protein [Terracidiphilus sp.]|jgi:Xaa-Pro aminopeptidase